MVCFPNISAEYQNLEPNYSKPFSNERKKERTKKERKNKERKKPQEFYKVRNNANKLRYLESYPKDFVTINQEQLNVSQKR